MDLWKLPKRELNYLLITPRTSTLPYPQNLGVLGGALWPVPMGMAYVSSSIKAVYQNVYNLNLDYETKDLDDVITEFIEKHRIDVVLTGGLAGQFSKIKSVIDSVKKVSEEIIVVIGGRCITPIPTVAMSAFESADIGIIGEGEITVRELVLSLNAGGDLGEIDGLIYKDQSNFVMTSPREDILDLDSLPFPDFAGLECGKVFNVISTAAVVAARSCPFSCTFCYGAAGKYRMRSIDNIISEIEFLITHYQVKSISLIDELFVSNKQRILEFCEKIKPYNISWGTTIHATGSQQKELFQQMHKSGCCALNLGVESGSERVLKSMNKRATLAQIESALKNIKEAKIGIYASLIFGDIIEDYESVEETLTWWRNNRQYPIELSRMYAIPGSHIYEYAVKNNIIKDEIEHLRNNCRECNFSKLTDSQYNEMSLRLTTEEAFNPYSPQSYSILSIDIDNQKTLVRYTCSCGFEGDVLSDGLLLSSSIRCPVCQQAYRLPFHEKYLMSRIRDKVKLLVENNERIAFWGLGREIQLLLRGIDISTLDGVFIVDADVKKQGLVFLGKRIFSPEIIQDEKIPLVIPSPLLLGGVHYVSTIEQEVARFAKVKIVSFGELLNLACPINIDSTKI